MPANGDGASEMGDRLSPTPSGLIPLIAAGGVPFSQLFGQVPHGDASSLYDTESGGS